MHIAPLKVNFKLSAWWAASKAQPCIVSEVRDFSFFMRFIHRKKELLKGFGLLISHSYSLFRFPGDVRSKSFRHERRERRSWLCVSPLCASRVLSRSALLCSSHIEAARPDILVERSWMRIDTAEWEQRRKHQQFTYKMRHRLSLRARF